MSKIEEWTQLQLEYASQLIFDDCNLSFPPSPFTVSEISSATAGMPAVHILAPNRPNPLYGPLLIGGVDISFLSEELSVAVCTLSVHRLSKDDHLELLHVYSIPVEMKEPYVPSFLAFREVSPLLELLEGFKKQMGKRGLDDFPQILMVDGNGRLHDRMCGSASVLGLRCGIPTIGVAKTPYVLSSGSEIPRAGEDWMLSQKGIRKVTSERMGAKGEFVYLYRHCAVDEHPFGAALRTSSDARNAIYISSGHMVSLETALGIVTACSRTRVPEPIRVADLASREEIKKLRDGSALEQLASSSATSVLSGIELSPSLFPWSREEKILSIQENRRRIHGGCLFFDELLKFAGIDHNLYPPVDILSFRRLENAINTPQNPNFDSLKVNCLVYYLLKDYDNAQLTGQHESLDSKAMAFARQKMIPKQFLCLTNGYYSLDAGLYDTAVGELSSCSLTSIDFAPKILKTLASPENPESSAKLVLRFIRTLPSSRTKTKEEVEIQLDAFAKISMREAWSFQRSIDEADFVDGSGFREKLVNRLFNYCLIPKPLPGPLRELLSFPFTSYEDGLLKSYCLAPPPTLSSISKNVILELANVRLISQGRFLEAIKLDRAIGPQGSDAEKRRVGLLDLVRLLPEVERRKLELEMDVVGVDMAASRPAPLTNGHSTTTSSSNSTQDDTAMSWESIDRPALQSYTNGNPTLTHSPLSASTALRSSTPQFGLLKAVIHQQSTPIKAAVSQQATPKQPFSLANPPLNESPRPVPFGDLSRSILASNQSPARQPLQQQTPGGVGSSPITKPSQSGVSRNPFAQAAQRASMLAQQRASPRPTSSNSLETRSNHDSNSVVPRSSDSKRAGGGEPLTIIPSMSFEGPAAEEHDDRMDIEDETLSLMKKPVSSRLKKSIAGTKRSVSERNGRKKDTNDDDDDDDDTTMDEPIPDVPGQFPGSSTSAAAGPRRSHRRTGSQASSVTGDDASAAPTPSTRRVKKTTTSTPVTRTSTRTPRRTAAALPGAFASTTHENEEEEETLDLPPLRASTRRKSQTGLNRPADLNPPSLPAGSSSKRNLRSSVTVSPEAVRTHGEREEGATPRATRRTRATASTTAGGTKNRRSGRTTGN